MKYFIDNDLTILTSQKLDSIIEAIDIMKELKEAKERFNNGLLSGEQLTLLKAIIDNNPLNEVALLKYKELANKIVKPLKKRKSKVKITFSKYKLNNRTIEKLKEFKSGDFEKGQQYLLVNAEDFDSFKEGDLLYFNLNRDLDKKENNIEVKAPALRAAAEDISITRITARKVSRFTDDVLLLMEKPALTKTELALINAIGIKIFFSIPASRRNTIYLHNKTHNGAQRLAMYRNITIPLEDLLLFYPNNEGKNRYKAIQSLTIDLERLQRTFVNTPLPYKEKKGIGRTPLDYPFNIITAYEIKKNRVEIHLNDYLVYFMLRGCIEANNMILQAVWADKLMLAQNDSFLKISEMLNHLASQKREKFYFYVSVKKLIISSGMLTAEEWDSNTHAATVKRGRVARRFCDYLNYLEDYYILFLEINRTPIDYPEKEPPKKILNSKVCVQKYDSNH